MFKTKIHLPVISLPVTALILVTSTVLITYFATKQDIKNIKVENITNYVAIQDNQSAIFTVTGYAIGHPYNTGVRMANTPVINKGFINIGGMDLFTVAVDPKVIPLGSLLYIEGLGIALATDTGTLIQGMRIDVAFSNMDMAMQWGKKDIRVYIIRRCL
jgi:3D (Asp-Asp-Asp) domain-containing protein